MGWIPGFHNAHAPALAPLHPHRTVVPGHAIRAPRAMMQNQRIEGPIGIGEHVNSAILADKNRHLRTCLTPGRRGFGRVQDGLRMLEETHSFLIAKKRSDSSRIGLYTASDDL
jgi:hypothetical protein